MDNIEIIINPNQEEVSINVTEIIENVKIEIVEENDQVLINSSVLPEKHAITHSGSGIDPIKLDNLAEPTDNTNLNSNLIRHGLLPKLEGSTDKFLRADGTWSNLEVTKAQVGLGNVQNIDTTNPDNIQLDSNHRFVTDNEKIKWNNLIVLASNAIEEEQAFVNGAIIVIRTDLV